MARKMISPVPLFLKKISFLKQMKNKSLIPEQSCAVGFVLFSHVNVKSICNAPLLIRWAHLLTNVKVCLTAAYMLIEDPVTGFGTISTTCKAEHKSPGLQSGQIHSQQLSDTLDQFIHQSKPKSVLTALNQPHFPLKTPVLCQTLVTEHHLFVVCIEMKC